MWELEAHFILPGNSQPGATLREWIHSSPTITIKCVRENPSCMCVYVESWVAFAHGIRAPRCYAIRLRMMHHQNNF